MHEHYRPASAPLVESRSAKPRSSVVAVLLGSLVVDWGGTLAVTTVISILWMVPLVMGGKSVDDMAAQVASLSYRMTIIALGAVMSVLGGYTAAAWARRRPEWHGFLAGLTTVSLGIVVNLQQAEAPDLLSLATPLLGLFGGRLAARRLNPR